MMGAWVPSTTYHWLLGRGLFCLLLIRYTSVSALYHVADIDFIGEHVGNLLNTSRVYCFSLLAACNEGPGPLIFGGIGNALIVEHPGNGSLSAALGKEHKHFADNSSSFFVYDKVSFSVGVFLVSVEGKRTDVESVLPSAGKDTCGYSPTYPLNTTR